MNKIINITYPFSILLLSLIVVTCNRNENNIDCDKDSDGCIDLFDDFPDNADYYRDTDGDGIPDPQIGTDSTEWDIDADGDNILDSWFGGTDTEVYSKPSCINDSDDDGCIDLFDHYPDNPFKDTNPDLYDTGEIPTCKDRMNDCDGKYFLY